MIESEDSRESKNAQLAKVADAMAAAQPLLATSICLKCVSHRTVVSGRGSVFMLCQSNKTPANWPKYPAQPLKQCGYFQA